MNVRSQQEQFADYVAQMRRGAQPAEPQPTEARPAAPTATRARRVYVRGRAYEITADDTLALFGALAMAVDGETARITLASGDVLDLTHQEVSDLGRQLAGKPADEVPGPDRGT